MRTRVPETTWVVCNCIAPSTPVSRVHQTFLLRNSNRTRTADWMQAATEDSQFRTLMEIEFYIREIFAPVIYM